MLRKGILNDCHCNDVESQSIETPGGRKATEQATVGWQGLAAECSWLRDGKKDTE